MYKINEKVIEKVEDLGWSVKEHDTYISFQQHSPAGEDLYLEVNKDEDIVDWAYDNYDNFDVDEHIEMWVDARHSGVSGVPSVRELVEDAAEIKKMYRMLYEVIDEFATDDADDEDDFDDEEHFFDPDNRRSEMPWDYGRHFDSYEDESDLPDVLSIESPTEVTVEKNEFDCWDTL